MVTDLLRGLGDRKETEACLPQPPKVPLNWWLTWLSFDQSSAETRTAASYTHPQ